MSTPERVESESGYSSRIDTGERNNLPLSSLARKIEDVYHYDVDLMQACKMCREPHVFMEATSSNKYKFTQVLRKIATHCGVPTILIRHDFGDVGHSHPIDISYWEPGRTGPEDEPDKKAEGVSWGTLIATLEGLRDRHRCDRLT